MSFVAWGGTEVPTSGVGLKPRCLNGACVTRADTWVCPYGIKRVAVFLKHQAKGVIIILESVETGVRNQNNTQRKPKLSRPAP